MRVAVMGAGAVGTSVLKLAEEYGHTVTAMADSSSATLDGDGLDAEAVLDRKNQKGIVGSGDPEDALDGEYDVLVEATPTTLGDAEPGFGHLREALERDRHVVLANKGPVAERYSDVRDLEADSAGEVRFEATVGGAIPVLSTIESFGPDQITAVRGVLNGTANFILTRMQNEGLSYEHVLAEAQDLGVAEADPTFDVEGTDAALKCVIVANVLGDDEMTLADATVEGIHELPASALDLADDDGQTIRLVGEVTDDGVRVGPRLIADNSALAVSGTQNIVQFDTTYAGSLYNSGRGAGGPETATAVFADIGHLD
ncbi:homoserine dehydrogenase [Halovenus halobia]|uniref:homoserine dehydrogenase n=1 Tax=Halovenus halobia TaxID=3396622 RepID=UPI003F5431C6